MNTVKIHGYSDDNIAVTADSPIGSDEYGHEVGFVVFDNGTVIKAEYSPEGYDSKWQVDVVERGDIANKITVQRATNDEDDYTDMMTVEGPFESYCFRPSHPMQREDWLDILELDGPPDYDEMTTDQLRQIVEWAKL